MHVYFFAFSVSFNFSCNLTRCQFGDFDMIFITLFLKSNINYIYSLRVSPTPQGKFWMHLQCSV
jgi:hypothetical protein